MAQSSRTHSDKGSDTLRSQSSRAFDPGKEKEYRRVVPALALKPVSPPWERASPFTAPANPYDVVQSNNYCPNQSNSHSSSTFTSPAAYTLNAPPPNRAPPLANTFDSRPILLPGRQSPSSQVYTSLFPAPTGNDSPKKLPPANRPKATRRPRNTRVKPLPTPATTPRLHTQPLAHDGVSNCDFSFFASPKTVPPFPQPNPYHQSSVENTGKWLPKQSSPSHSGPTPEPSPVLQLKVEDTSDEGFFLSKVPSSDCVSQSPWTSELAHLQSELGEAFAEASFLSPIPVDFGPPRPNWNRSPFFPKSASSSEPPSTPKVLDSYPEWIEPFQSESHELSPPDSSPLKLYPRANHKSRVTRSCKRVPDTQPSTPVKKRKVTSGTSKLFAQRNECASPAETSVPAQLRIVKSPVQPDTVEALDASNNIVALVRLPAFPGYPSARYIIESALGQNFSHFGKTRLLPTFRPGRKIRQFTFTQIEKMGPSYRNSNRRQNRTVEHDIFEGLPVRQWRKENITIAPPPSSENSSSQNDVWAVELPHGMPKDSHLLPQHSQDLLRAARSGKIYAKRPAPVEEEEVDPEVILGDKPDKKEDDTKIQGYTVKTWKQIPRHLEGPDIEYLAKRRKHLVTVSSKPTAGPTLTKATVKRTDATGTEYLQDVVVAPGQQIEGEVVSQTTIPDPNAQPVDPYAVAPTPPKKKGPVIRKKAKGPGRGRKKKQAAPTSVPAAPPVPGAAPITEGAVGAAVPEGIKAEPTDGATPVTPATNEDVEMGEGSAAASDDEEEGEEGDDDDEGSVSNQGSPSKRPRTTSPGPSSLPTMGDIPDLVSAPAPAPLPNLGSSPVSPFAAHLEREKLATGSPLKNVALATSALASPTGVAAPPFSDPAPVQAPPMVSTEVPQPAEIPQIQPTSLDTVMQDQVAETAPTELPPVPPNPTIVEEITAVVERKEEEEEEEMLLNIVENANIAQVGSEAPAPVIEAPPVSEPIVEAQPEVPVPVAEQPAQQMEPPEMKMEPEPERIAEPVSLAQPEILVPQAPLPEPAPPAVEEQKTPEPIPEALAEQPVASIPESAPEAIPEPIPEPVSEPVPEQAPEVEDEDDFPDLLGGLEKSLSSKPAPAPEIPAPVVAEKPAEDATEKKEE